MKVENKINIYQIDGKDTSVGETTDLIVRSVWNKPKFIELQIGDGKKVVVYAHDLTKALKNATDND